MDIGPTILDLLGFDVPAGVQGRSLFEPSRVPRVYFFSEQRFFDVWPAVGELEIHLQ